ncbi:MAG: DNA replication and repair protein RecF [Candidatus Peregrinibacteria bacterium]|nr:DNA replication and repair protein RecF [Candidatus Peregrinibacteria bacterium]
MKLSSLHLENFRNYARLDFAFPDEPIVILSGENAQGKTNFLEAMYLMAITKSFRIGDREFLKQFDKDYFRIEARGVSGGQYQANKTSEAIHLEMCEIHAPQHQRVLKKNGTKISAPKFLGHIKAVLFRPEDLHILTGEPALRRKYLNTILIQTIPGYMRQLQTYQKLLSQRNALLLQIKLGSASMADLDIWDPPLAEAGAALLTSRIELVDFLRKQLYEQVGAALYEIEYACFLHNSALPQLQNELQSLLLQTLVQARSRDTRSTHTSVGPHRDDLRLKIRGYPLELTASRGELRSALMGLKQAEIAWFSFKTGETPIILLDDIFSELDSNRKNDIFEPIFNGVLAPLLTNLPSTTQIIMTVADGNPLPTSPKLRSASTVRKVHGGQIIDQ